MKKKLYMLFLLLSILMNFGLFAQYPYYLTLTAIFRDEAPYLKEWIEYYSMMGVEHFYLYNNLSGDHYEDVLQPYVDQGLVDLIEWPYQYENRKEWGKIQNGAYRDALNLTNGQTKWLIVVDTDEFIVPNQHENISDMIKALEAKDKKETYAQYEIHWVIFGTSGVESIPSDRLMVEMLTQNGGVHEFAKSIIRPEYAGDHINPHKMSLIGKKKSRDVKDSLAVINHYMFRDRHYLYQVKIPRRESVGFTGDAVLKWEAACCENNAYSRTIFRFVNNLRSRMGLSGDSQ